MVVDLIGERRERVVGKCLKGGVCSGNIGTGQVNE